MLQNKVLSSLSYAGRNPFKQMKYNILAPQKFGTGILAHTLDYSMNFQSDFHQKIYQTERTSVKLNIFYLHAWIIDQRVKNLVLNTNLTEQYKESLTNIIKHHNTFLYSHDFDEFVFMEL